MGLSLTGYAAGRSLTVFEHALWTLGAQDFQGFQLCGEGMQRLKNSDLNATGWPGACVRARVRACVRACAHVCMCVCVIVLHVGVTEKAKKCWSSKVAPVGPLPQAIQATRASAPLRATPRVPISVCSTLKRTLFVPIYISTPEYGVGLAQDVNGLIRN